MAPTQCSVLTVQRYAAGKKKQRKKAGTDIDALLASMGEAPADTEVKPETSDADEPAASKQKEKRKKKERKPAGDVDALLAQLEGGPAPEDAETTPSSGGPAQPEEVAQPEAQADAQHEPPEASMKDKAKKKKKQQPAGKGGDEDIDALLAEIGGDSSVREPEQRTDDSATAVEEPEEAPPAMDSTATAAPAAHAPSKKSKKKKGKQVCKIAHHSLHSNSLRCRKITSSLCMRHRPLGCSHWRAIDLCVPAGEGAG